MKYILCTYSRYILYRSVVVQSYTIKDEVVNSLTPRKYTLFNGKFVFDLCDFFRNITLA